MISPPLSFRSEARNLVVPGKGKVEMTAETLVPNAIEGL